MFMVLDIIMGGKKKRRGCGMMRIKRHERDNGKPLLGKHCGNKKKQNNFA